ncbi:MAG: peptidylprolyl isomerase [Planctomycetes bacterium]|nr:peptidylprolyl isomerase [Planctomycetota bacterium]
MQIHIPLLVVALLALPVPGRTQGHAKPATQPAGQKAKAPKDIAKDKAVQAIDKFIADAKIDKKSPEWRLALPLPPQQAFDKETTYFWHVQTNKGALKIKLMPDVAPMHVTNAIYLARLGFYDGIPFHRVITRFMAQGGCPLGRGTGSPGYRFDGEFHPSVKHDRPGLLSMANAGPGTDGSQFFLTFVPTPHLDGKHTIFGEIVEGSGTTLKALEEGGSRSGTPTEPLKMEKTWITVE